MSFPIAKIRVRQSVLDSVREQWRGACGYWIYDERNPRFSRTPIPGLTDAEIAEGIRALLVRGGECAVQLVKAWMPDRNTVDVIVQLGTLHEVRHG